MPLPLPMSTSTTVALKWLTTRSGMPLPVRSSTTTSYGPEATGYVDHGLERAFALAQKDAHRVVVLVGDDDVGNAVAVQVGHLDVVGSLPAGKSIVGLKGAVAVAQEHAHVRAGRSWP